MYPLSTRRAWTTDTLTLHCHVPLTALHVQKLSCLPNLARMLNFCDSGLVVVPISFAPGEVRSERKPFLTMTTRHTSRVSSTDLVGRRTRHTAPTLRAPSLRAPAQADVEAPVPASKAAALGSRTELGRCGLGRPAEKRPPGVRSAATASRPGVTGCLQVEFRRLLPPTPGGLGVGRRCRHFGSGGWSCASQATEKTMTPILFPCLAICSHPQTYGRSSMSQLPASSLGHRRGVKFHPFFPSGRANDPLRGSSPRRPAS